MHCPDLRILLLSTPKTGNTWLRNLLSTAYRLPQLTVTAWPFDSSVLDRESGGWITHHHYAPSPAILDWIDRNRVVLITTVRHPADILVSMYHHVRQFQTTTIDLHQIRSMLHSDFDRTGIFPQSVGEPFHYDLACSADWMQTGLSHLVRYEELRFETARVLTELTARIRPVTPDRIEAAIAACDMELMRSLAGPFAGFFREGRVGAWTDVLAPDIVQVLRDQEPYRSQIAMLGYSMELSQDCLGRELPKIEPCVLQRIPAFDNGVPVSPILIKCFLHSDDDLRRGWTHDPAATGPSSFFEWLRAPAPIPGDGPDAALNISNLAHFLYFDRHDLRTAFPDLRHGNRKSFVEWFQYYPESEYGLDRALIEAA